MAAWGSGGDDWGSSSGGTGWGTETNNNESAPSDKGIFKEIFPYFFAPFLLYYYMHLKPRSS